MAGHACGLIEILDMTVTRSLVVDILGVVVAGDVESDDGVSLDDCGVPVGVFELPLDLCP